jgi:hypothetical protein
MLLLLLLFLLLLFFVVVAVVTAAVFWSLLSCVSVSLVQSTMRVTLGLL